MKRRHGKPYFWVSWLAPLIAGENSCYWKVWVKGHYQLFDEDKRADLADNSDWTTKHTRILNATIKKRGAPNSKAHFIEGQTSWRVEGTNAIIAGKMDLITVGPNVVYDAKSGRAKDSHAVQAKIYLYAIRQKGVPVLKDIDGEFRAVLVYPDGEKKVDPPDKAFSAALGQTLARLYPEDPPAQVPSLFECRYCEIADCPKRFKEQAAEIQTEDF